MDEQIQIQKDNAEKRVQKLIEKAKDKDGDIFEALESLFKIYSSEGSNRNRVTIVGGALSVLENLKKSIFITDAERAQRLENAAEQKKAKDKEALKEELYQKHMESENKSKKGSDQA